MMLLLSIFYLKKLLILIHFFKKIISITLKYETHLVNVDFLVQV